MVERVEFVKYEAGDGALFNTEDAANAYEARLSLLKHAMRDMPAVVDPNPCGFANGEGFKRWPIEVASRTRSFIMNLVVSWAPHLACAAPDNKWYIGRALSDSDTSPGLYVVFMRLFFNIDDEGREFGQKYYRNNPHEAGTKEYV